MAERNCSLYSVYHDPGPPPYLDTLNTDGELSQAYKWAFTLVPIWQSHHDPTDGVMLDISPAFSNWRATRGNFPNAFSFCGRRVE